MSDEHTNIPYPYLAMEDLQNEVEVWACGPRRYRILWKGKYQGMRRSFWEIADYVEKEIK